MEFEAHCDESRPDLFASKRNTIGRYLVIGSLWFRAAERSEFKEEIKRIRRRHSTFGEIKWRSVAPSRLPFYLELVDWFFAKGLDCRYRCIVAEAAQVDLTKFHDADQELGFYKFYYQLLHHWVLDFNSYRIFVDHKRNRDRDRLPVLRRCLQRANLSARIEFVQALNSRDSQFIQLTDLLTGAVGHRLHGFETSQARLSVVRRIESRLNWDRIRGTSRSFPKFNVFRIDLGGGW